MKQPTRDGKGAGGGHRRDMAEEETRVLGSHDSGGAATHIATPVQLTPPVASRDTAESGHTRILGYETAGYENVRADPVVGWLVVLDGPGKGSFRPIFKGSNTIGRSGSQRVPIDFGDDAISSEKQAFLTYDERKRSYQLVPNLERPNLVYHNDAALTSNVDLKQHDKVMMGRTTLLFVPLCGPDFDWGELK